MRRYLAKLLAFTALLALVFALAEALADAWSQERAELVYQAFFDPAQNPEGIILGTSTAVFGLHPADLDAPGTAFYNFAYQGSSPQYLAWWYDAYREQDKRPRIVVHAVDWFSFAGAPARAIAHDSEHLPLSLVWRLAITPGTDRSALFGNRFALVKRRADLQALLVRGHVPESAIRELTPRYQRGWLPLLAGKFNANPPKPGLDVVNPAQVLALRQVYATMQADGVRVVLVQLPHYLPLAGSHPAALAPIEAVAQELGLPFLNYNAELASALNRDRSAFLDWGHLNERGSRQLGPRLHHDLVARGLLPAARP